MDNTVALAAIALASTTTIGFFKVLSKLSRSMDKMTDSNNRIAHEAEERNNHLANLIIKTAKTVKAQAKGKK